MSMSNGKIIEKFVKGATKGKACRMFIEGNILYDFGYHFPLLVRRPDGFLMNADHYSMTTSHHQSICSRHANFLIPFSILRSLRLDHGTVKIIDQAKEVWETREYKDKDGEVKTIEERRPASLVMANPDNGKCYLASMDNNNYFASELPEPAWKIEQAFDSLKPTICLNKVEGIDYLRQGEWFFIPVDSKPIKSSIQKGMEKETKYIRIWNNETKLYEDKPEKQRLAPVEFLRNRNKELQPHHYATEYGFNLGYPELVRGTVRHTNGDHRMLRLSLNGKSRQWFMAIESNHVLSVGVGRVD